MINEDLMRSYKQYTKHQRLNHISISGIKKLILSLMFFLLIPTIIIKIFYTIFNNKKNNFKLYIFPFTDKEPMKTVVDNLHKIKYNKIMINPSALHIFPYVLLTDFIKIFIQKPLWSLKNLDFFGALSLKISQYYGYKIKYGISKLLLFQEYSFYSSYLTYIFEKEGGSLYCLMHGIPGRESSFFRFTKCFVWGNYFKQYYIVNKAKLTQFIVSGSIYHTKLQTQRYKNNHTIYDILYALQGDEYLNKKYTYETFEVLKKIQKKFNLKIAIKEHPIYPNKEQIPDTFDIITVPIHSALSESKIVISHFSTIFLDAKIMHKQVLSFLPESKTDLVGYLNKKEICFHHNDLYDKILLCLKEDIAYPLSNEVIVSDLNTVEIIENEIYNDLKNQDIYL